MTTLTHRRTNPIADMLGWLESESAAGAGLMPYVRLEDFVEDDIYVVRAEMPGIDPATDVDIAIDNGVLTIKGERREELHDRQRHELHYGAFSRSINLPAHADVETCAATYKAGVLELRVPLATTAPEPRKITIQNSDG